MARIRSIKPEFWTDEKIVELDFADRLLFIGLWNFADDQGYLDLRPKRIKMQVFPGDDYDVLGGLKRLWESSLLSLYETDQGVVVSVKHWQRHQRVSNPARERFKAHDLHVLDEWPDDVQSPREGSRVLGKGREGKGSTSSSEIADAIPDAAADREDATRLCDHLATRIATNTGKRPEVGKRWLDAARLIIDRDEFTEAQVHWLIDKCQDDEFWRANILSMPKLREKATQLRLKFAPPLAVVAQPDGSRVDADGVRYLSDGSVDEASLPPVEQSWMKRRPQ